MSSRIQSVVDVARYQLCCGCGACAYLAPDEIAMVDMLELGRRPMLKAREAKATRGVDALTVCPGVHLEKSAVAPAGAIPDLRPGWGSVLEVWEGYAADPELRFAGSSGGGASALALFSLEKDGAHGVLHTASREEAPYLNKTVLSRSREEILARSGSRYAPASPCEGLAMVENAPGPCVFIGKPCDVAGFSMLEALRPGLRDKTALTISIFCAGTPSTRGTLEMLQTMGVNELERIVSVRYRGNGWPGQAVARFTNARGEIEERSLTYQASWGDILQKHRQWRCYVCADHTGEFADVAVADPWYRTIPPGEPGRSLVVVRSERGREAVRKAIEAGYIVLEPVGPEKLPASQPRFEEGRGALWGRLLFLRLLGVPTPRYRGFPMFRFWWTRLGWKDKLKSTLGTVRRVHRKRLRHPVSLEPFAPFGLGGPIG